jgi:hypothetical protein
MTRPITATTLVVIVVGAVGIAVGAYRQASMGEGDDFRNLLLHAWGSGKAGAGRARIPIPVEGSAYEVIIAKPGEPRAVPLR